MIKIRDARPSDKEPLMSFIRNIWGGHDYLPHVWDDWLKDKDSRMFVILVDGKQVGMSRVRFLEDGSAWFEGGRVHPQFRGRGLASALGERCMEAARERGISVFRLTSSSFNKPAHRQIARIGFKETARVSVYVPPNGQKFEAVMGVNQADKKDVARVTRMIRSSREFILGAGVMWDTFAARELSARGIAQAVADGSVYTASNAVAVARPGGEGKETWKQICFLAGNGDDAVRVVKYLFGRREKFKTDGSFIYVPKGSRLIRDLRRAGMKRHFSMILFERRAAKG